MADRPEDALAETVRRSAVTETVVPEAVADTVAPAPAVTSALTADALGATVLPAPPTADALGATVLPAPPAADALGATVRRSAVTDTVVPPAAIDTVVPAGGTDDTVAAGAGAGSSRDGTSTEPPPGGSAATLVRFDPEADTLRTVGDELRHATIEKFGEVGDDRFEVLSELARGGLGQVLRARDPRTGRIVAIKQVLRPNRELVTRFAREALVTANLQHPSIVPVYEVGRWHAGEPFYAMKLVRGRALDALIDEAKTSAARVALVPHVIAIADALAYAHGERVIHRDLKPANVLVGPYGETVVIDWGLARNLASDEDVATPPPAPAVAAPGETVAGAVMGTPSYMAPEQARGQPLDERADVYAIGAILYHVLAGVRPYHQARTVDGILEALAAGPPRALAALAPDVAPELIAICGKAMARARDDRYPTARELAEDLRRFQAGQLVGAHRYSSRELVRRWLRRHRAAAATAAIALGALAVFGVVSVRRIAAERDRARAQSAIARRERADAADARALAERRLGDSLAELGRQAALAGEPGRALPFLAGAAAATDAPSPALAVLLGQARAAYDDLLAVAPLDDGGTASAALAEDGGLLLTVSAGGRLRAWDLATRAVRWTADDVALVSATGGRELLAVTPAGEATLRATADGAVRARWSPPPGWDPRDRPVMLAGGGVDGRFAIGTVGGRVAIGAPGAAALVDGEPHGHEVWSLDFSADGRTLASTADGEPVALRDAQSGRIVRRLVDRSAAAGTSAVAAEWTDDDELYSVDSDRRARRWRASDGAALARYPQDHDLYGLAIGRDLARMVTFGDGDSALLWDRAGAAPTPLTGHRIGVQHALFVGDRVVTADESGRVLVWDARTGERADEVPEEGAVYGVRALGDRVLLYGSGRPRVWRVGGDAPLARLHGHLARVRDLVFDERGVLWSASHDGSARGVPPAALTAGAGAATAAVVLGAPAYREPVITEATQAVGPPDPRGLRSLALVPDGTRIATAREDGSIELWERASGRLLATWRGHTGRVRRIVFAADGAIAFSVGDQTVRRWDVASGRELAQATVDGDGWDVALVDGGRRLATLAGEPQRIALWDAATLAPATTPAVTLDRLRGLVPVDDGLLVATPDQVVLLDRDGRQRAAAAHGQAFAAALGLAGTQPVIAVSDARGEVVLHDRATLAPVRSWPTGLGVVAAAAFRPDGRILAIAGGRVVQLWDPATGQLLASSPDVGAVIAQLTWSPDGATLAFAGGSGTVWTWRVAADDGRGLADLAACASPFRLEQAALTAATLDPARCPPLAAAPPP